LNGGIDLKDINLMPREYILEEKRKKFQAIFLTLGCSFLLLVISGISLPFKIINNKTQELKKLNSLILDSKYEVISEVHKQLKQKNEELKSMQKLENEIKKESIVSIKVLDLLTGYLPSEMYFQKLIVDNNNKVIKIEGNAGKAEHVSEYVVQLSNLPFVEKVEMKTSTEEVKSKNNFSDKAFDGLQVVKYEVTLQMRNEEGISKKDEIQRE
jgi:Tfp pilus assembly protein PilN